ncbi:MAG: hypothetical protein IKS42_03865 [Oscillospiraceae bacterium]|nr:hypothetical protein [Oscillospiraceae bacterium]
MSAADFRHFPIDQYRQPACLIKAHAGGEKVHAFPHRFRRNDRTPPLFQQNQIRGKSGCDKKHQQQNKKQRECSCFREELDLPEQAEERACKGGSDPKSARADLHIPHKDNDAETKTAESSRAAANPSDPVTDPYTASCGTAPF